MESETGDSVDLGSVVFTGLGHGGSRDIENEVGVLGLCVLMAERK